MCDLKNETGESKSSHLQEFVYRLFSFSLFEKSVFKTAEVGSSPLKVSYLLLNLFSSKTTFNIFLLPLPKPDFCHLME